MARERTGASSSFDELAIGLSSGSVSRRKALKLMGAALLGGTLGALGGVAAGDELCKPDGKKCKKNAQCCSGTCCSDKCTNLQTDPNNCGFCGNVCSSGNCVNGACSACPSGTVELSNGTCARPCPTGGDCSAGGVACGCFRDTSTLQFYCGDASTGSGSCARDEDCPRGQFCTSPACVGAC